MVAASARCLAIISGGQRTAWYLVRYPSGASSATGTRAFADRMEVRNDRRPFNNLSVHFLVR
jgi:hypothetical protein